MSLELPVIAPTTETAAEIASLQSRIRDLARQRKAVVIAHNYQRPEVQDVADFVGDSLGLSRKAAETDADVIVFCGVHFMAETAAILAPRKRVLLPDLRAGCSLAATITGEDVRRWREKFPGYIAVGYVNTTAEVKAELDYCCTSGNVLEVIDAIPEDKGILFCPDFFLGAHVRRNRPNRRIEVWLGECHVHKGIRAETLNAARREHPEAEVLVHPECGCAGQLIYEMGLGGVAGRGTPHCFDRGHGPPGERAAGSDVHRGHRNRDHAPDATGGAGQAVHRRRPGGRLRLHEDHHAAQPPRGAHARSVPHHGTRGDGAEGTAGAGADGHPGSTVNGERGTGNPEGLPSVAGQRQPGNEAIPPASARANATRVARMALEEDGPRDLTTGVTGAGEAPTVGRIEYRSGGILAGREWADAVARETGCETAWAAEDGDRIGAGGMVGTMTGSFAAVLRAERPLLNLLQRACGIANATGAYVVAVAGTGCRVLHTRKTAPGLRLLDIAAVLAGGGTLHRLDLSHTVMIKDNHWQALAQSGVSLTEALVRARQQGAASCQVEVESLSQVEVACRGRRRPPAHRQPVARLRARVGSSGPPAQARHRDRSHRRDRPVQCAGLRGGRCRLRLGRGVDPFGESRRSGCGSGEK